MAIELSDMQSAEPKECGSCEHFNRRDNSDSFGLCMFRLPPWVQSKPEPPEADSDVNSRTVSDTDGCTLYDAKNLAGDAAQFVQKRYWNAGNPSR